MLVPVLNTWSGVPPQKFSITPANFVGHQMIRGNGSVVRGMGLTGTKNRTQNAVATSGTNYWVTGGNEYLPASLSIQVSNAVSTMAAASNVNMLASAAQMVTNCLVQFNGGFPEFQYGYFESSLTLPANASNVYVAAQGYNLAQLLTPQVERAFNMPVDSATLVSILTNINHAQTLSNGCHSPTKPTQWTTVVNEWVNVPSNGVVVLNFFPTTSTAFRRDAWLTNSFTGGTYTPTNRTLTIANVTNAPSQLIFSNEVFLGCETLFTNTYGGHVPALTENALAGVPMTENFLTQIRTALVGVLGRFQTNGASCIGCEEYDLASALQAAGRTNTTWTAVTDGLIRSNHIAELQQVIGVLTHEMDCCCSNSVIALSPAGTLTPGTISIGYTNQVTATHGCSSYTYGSGNLPSWLSLVSTNGLFHGTPTTAGTNLFNITATDTNGCVGSTNYVLVVNPPGTEANKYYCVSLDIYQSSNGSCQTLMTTTNAVLLATGSYTNYVWGQCFSGFSAPAPVIPCYGSPAASDMRASYIAGSFEFRWQAENACACGPP